MTLSNAATVATLKTPLKVTHAANCGANAPTLNVQMDTVHDGSLTLGGNKVHSSPKLLFRYDFPAAATSGTHTFAAGTWRDFPDLTYTPTLTKTSTLLLVHYQISYSIGVSADSMGVSANGDVPMLQIDGRRHRRDLSAVDRRRWRIRHLLGDVDRRDHGRRQPRDQGAVPQR